MRARESAAHYPCFLKTHFTDSGRKYFSAAADSSFVDDSFAIIRGKTVSVIVECNASGNALGRFGGPLEVRVCPTLESYEIREDILNALGELQKTAKARNAAEILVRTTFDNDPYGFVASRLVAAGAACRSEIRAEVDLSLSEEQLLSDLRSSHRQRLKWGRENLEIVSATGPFDRRMLDRYREFHTEISGRVTRPAASWDAMYSWVESGAGELAIGLQGDKLLAGSIVLDALGSAYYFSAVYDRVHFDKPLGHFLVYTMILRAKKRGLRLFDLGTIHPSNEQVEDKERAIGHFKHGFTGRSVNSTIWTIPVS